MQVFESILVRDIWIALVKSVVFATIIVQVGYHRWIARQRRSRSGRACDKRCGG